MDRFETSKIRNVAVLGHGGEGKTSLCEVILYNAKAIDRLGKVAEGNTVMDFDEQEIARQISISLAISCCEWKGVKLNLIDVPGFFDFDGEMVEAIRAASSGLIVVSAAGIVPVGCEKAIKYCKRNKMPMMIFINSMDKENADYMGTVNALSERYPRNIAPISIPIMEGQKMKGYINVLDRKAFLFSEKGPQAIDIPAEYIHELDEIFASLVETAAESDDFLLEKFFSGQKLTYEEVKSGIQKGIALERVIPVLAGSAIFNKGVFNLMDEMVGCLPSPDMGANALAEAEKGDLVEIPCKSDAYFSAQVFKTIADPFVGKLNYFKIYSGKVQSGMSLYNSNTDKIERISAVLIPKGKRQEPIAELVAGDIGVFAKLQNTFTGDTLCDPAYKIRFNHLEFPKPVLFMSISSVKTGDEDKVFGGLKRLMEEDLTFVITKNVDTKETLIGGLGETQLEIICKKLKTKFNADAVISTPKVPYRETIRKVVEAEGKHKKQSGGHGQYGHCKIRFEPCPEAVFVFGDEVVGGSVPRNFIPAVEKGLRECLGAGVLAGCPVVGLKAVLYDGSYHDVDSSEESFKIAAHLAFRDGMKRAMPVLLEPIYSLEIRVPENSIGDVMGDLNKRRGRILGMEAVDGIQNISAEAPLAEIAKYATDLRSITQGRGKFSMKESRYEEVPAALVGKIVAERASE